MLLAEESIKRVISDFVGLNLGDPRRTRRVVDTVRRLAYKSDASFPDAMGSERAIEGAYRLMNSPFVDFSKIHDGHCSATVRRAIESGDVLAIHDTSTCKFIHADPEEIGYLPTGKAGFLLHACLLVDLNNWRRPLGVPHVEILARPQRSRSGTRRNKTRGGDTAKWNKSEFERWKRGVNNVEELLVDCANVIHVSDREADAYELLAHMTKTGTRFVTRARHNRRARDTNAADDQAWSSLSEILTGAEGRIEREVAISSVKLKTAPRAAAANPPRDARTAVLSFSSAQVELQCPNHRKKDLPKSIRLNVVHVFEVDPPKGETAIKWTLYTTEPVETIADIEKVVDIYRTRWLIEEFFKALKTGCIYQKREFESRKALLVLLALSIPIACELLWIRSRARTDPTAPATDVFTPTQIEVVRNLSDRTVGPEPTAREVLWALAGMGGHIKSNGEPGWQILGRAYRDLLAYEAVWDLAQKSKNPKPPNL